LASETRNKQGDDFDEATIRSHSNGKKVTTVYIGKEVAIVDNIIENCSMTKVENQEDERHLELTALGTVPTKVINLLLSDPLAHTCLTLYRVRKMAWSILRN